jgi:putative ubiquitin-RnfH superfamily antitoxin RatB of RatAB toxin-antitoxin module
MPAKAKTGPEAVAQPGPEVEAGAGPRTIVVEVACATAKKQVVLRVELPAGGTVAEAIERSGIRAQFPGLLVDPAAVGIFSRKADLEQALRAGDRVEIYRPLIADPKEVRRQRAVLAQPRKDGSRKRIR